MPSPNMAGLMAGAILSDTVMFKSPTCTKRDIAMAERLARIANVSLKELGNLLFAASSAGDKSADELCFTDFKEFHIADHYLGVGQVTSLDSAAVLERKDELLALIGELTVQMREIFIERFKQINYNYGIVFAEMFGGGKGELKLSDPDDILHSGI